VIGEICYLLVVVVTSRPLSFGEGIKGRGSTNLKLSKGDF